MYLLAISGSLRRVSSNTALLRAAAALAPDHVEISLYSGLGDLPHFNPDLEGVEPIAVSDLRARVSEADGLIISSPEYAHGPPGALKNALDWLVGGDEFLDKPIALLSASPRAIRSQEMLTETITVMTGRIVNEASITVPLLGKNLDEAGILLRPEFADPLRAAIAAFVRTITGLRNQMGQ